MTSKRLRSTVLSAAGTVAVALIALFPRQTHADEIPDYERQGEYEEDGMKFGNVLVKGELVAAAKAPGGWALVRTLENQSDRAESITVEERILRTESMPEARVSPAPVAVVLRNQPIVLGPHEKRKIGIALPASVGEQITAGIKAKAYAEQARARALAAEKWDSPDLNRTYMDFHVEYLKPLPPGATAQRPENNGVTRPERMFDNMPTPSVAPDAPPSNLQAMGL